MVRETRAMINLHPSTYVYVVHYRPKPLCLGLPRAAAPGNALHRHPSMPLLRARAETGHKSFRIGIVRHTVERGRISGHGDWWSTGGGGGFADNLLRFASPGFPKHIRLDTNQGV